MLIDWLSLKLSTEHLDIDLLRDWQSTQDRILKISGTGEKVWEISAWESIRSDSHQIAFQVSGSFIRIQGSPARVFGDGDNVFSGGCVASLDLYECAALMVRFVSKHTGLFLPWSPCWSADWKLTRVDVTENLFLGSLSRVRESLVILRSCEGGRYKVNNTAGDTVYWSSKSRMRSGKAYAKGAELVHKMRTNKGQFRQYSPNEIAVANGLLRLELKLGAQFWRESIGDENPFNLKPDFLSDQWKLYFLRMIGGIEIMSEHDIYGRILAHVGYNEKGKPKIRQAQVAYSLWLLIKNEGWERARNITTKTTWYRNISILRQVGLSDADISSGTIVPLRKKLIEAVPVSSWDQLFRLAAA